eukprot:3434955-Prymnesium_polylepis.1
MCIRDRQSAWGPHQPCWCRAHRRSLSVTAPASDPRRTRQPRPAHPPLIEVNVWDRFAPCVTGGMPRLSLCSDFAGETRGGGGVACGEGSRDGGGGGS